MAKKVAGKAAPTRGLSPVAIVGIVVVVAAVGALLFWPGSNSNQAATDGAANPAAAAASEELSARAAAKAAVGPHTQAAYPPLPVQAYAPPRSQEVVNEAYKFAAEHPEILSYVPCFCGCERAGHEGNTDCFVKKRDANGDVVEWDEHGLDCAVCIDVATASRQMFASGASVRDIRAAIDKQFGSVYPGSGMPTPQPPAKQADGHANHAGH